MIFFIFFTHFTIILFEYLNNIIDYTNEKICISNFNIKHSNSPDKSIIAGESGVGGLTGLLSILLKDDDISNNLKSLLSLGTNSVILCVNTEGSTNPDLYKEITKRKPIII